MTSYRDDYPPDRYIYLPYQACSIHSHTKSRKFGFLIIISPISSHLCLSRPQLYHHLRTWSLDIPLNRSMPWSVLVAMVVDRHFRSGYGLEWNERQIGGLGLQYTRTDDSGTLQLTSPYPSELGRFSAGCPAGPSVNSYNILAFAIG
jgi:hypothetical protein